MPHDFYQMWLEEICEKAKLCYYKIHSRCRKVNCLLNLHYFVVDSSFHCIEIHFIFINGKVDIRNGLTYKCGPGPESVISFGLADPECENKAIRFLRLATPMGVDELD